MKSASIAILGVMLVTLFGQGVSVVGSSPPRVAPLPGGPRIDPGNPLAGGMTYDDVRRVVAAGVATVLSVDNCVPIEGYLRPHATTRYELYVEEAWLGELGQLEVYSEWAICNDDVTGGERVYDTSDARLLHFLREGDRIAFLAERNRRNEEAADGANGLGPVLVATLVEGPPGFVEVRSDVLWDVVRAIQGAEAPASDIASLRAKEGVPNFSESELRAFWKEARRTVDAENGGAEK